MKTGPFQGRKHGEAPYRTVVVHGGPGAAGSLEPLAEKLSERGGILEPFQTKTAIPELVSELRTQLEETEPPVLLIGHSWGAWLTLAVAVRYPETVGELVWIGCPPLEEKYVPQIAARRLQNLTPEEGKRFLGLSEILKENPDDRLLAELGRLAEKSDGYRPDPSVKTIRPDAAAYAAIWEQAADWRKRGVWKKALTRLRCPVWVIHGEQDPHPAEGVTEPLRASGAVYRTTLLPRCGHAPFSETEARETFFRLLQAAIR